MSFKTLYMNCSLDFLSICGERRTVIYFCFLGKPILRDEDGYSGKWCVRLWKISFNSFCLRRFWIEAFLNSSLANSPNILSIKWIKFSLVLFTVLEKLSYFSNACFLSYPAGAFFVAPVRVVPILKTDWKCSRLHELRKGLLRIVVLLVACGPSGDLPEMLADRKV